jgi:hypothetical protein
MREHNIHLFLAVGLLLCAAHPSWAARDGRGYWNRDKVNRPAGARVPRPGYNLFGEPVAEKTPAPAPSQAAPKVSPDQLYANLKTTTHTLLEVARTALAGKKEPALAKLLKALEEFEASVTRANSALMTFWMLEGLGEGSSASFPNLDVDTKGDAVQAAFGAVTGVEDVRKTWVEQALPALTAFMDRVNASRMEPGRRSETFRKLHGIKD